MKDKPDLSKLFPAPQVDIPPAYEAIRHEYVGEVEIRNMPSVINTTDLIAGFKQEFDKIAPYVTPMVYAQSRPDEPSKIGVKILLDRHASLAAVLNAFASVYDTEITAAGLEHAALSPIKVTAERTLRISAQNPYNPDAYRGPRLNGH